MKGRHGAPLLILIVLALATTGGVTWGAFSAMTTNPGNSFTSAAAFLDHFEFDPISRADSGKAMTVTVRAKSASNVTVTSFNGTVAFSTGSGSIAPTTSNSFVNGVLTQSVTITGSYNANETITATGSGATGTSAAFTLHDWDFYFKKTTADTGTNCVASTRLRDMEEGYTGSDPEESFTRVTGGAIYLRFCTPTFAANDTLAAGTTAVTAWTDNSAGSGCAVTATLYKVSGGTATSLGSTSVTVPQTSGLTQRTWTLANTGTTFAAGDRLNLQMALTDVKACGSTDIFYGGTTNRSHVQLPGP